MYAKAVSILTLQYVFRKKLPQEGTGTVEYPTDTSTVGVILAEFVVAVVAKRRLLS